MKKILLPILLAVILLAAGGLWFVKGLQMSGAPKEEAKELGAVVLPDRQEAQTEATVATAGSIELAGQTYSLDTRQIELSAVTEEDLSVLSALTALEQVTVSGGTKDALLDLNAYCKNNSISLKLLLNGQPLTGETRDLTVEAVTEEQAALLVLAPWLETLHFPEPVAAAESLLALEQLLPDTKITWEKTILGMTFSKDATVIDLTPVTALAEGEAPGTKTAYEYCMEAPIMGTQEEDPSAVILLESHPFPDKSLETEQLIAEVEAAMAYFPQTEKLLMCGTWLENESMAQFRERHREDYKVVWSVFCGGLSPRTDTTFFMPTKYYVTSGNFNDFYSQNLKYCEDVISMDIGHMHVSDIDFVRYMPNLKYLVLFSQPVFDLTPLTACEELVYLELYHCEFVEDYSPLQECAALEDLNISGNECDITPILEMDWLKNLWIMDYDSESYQKACAALPNTNIGYNYGNADDGWRSLPNYFKMRDALLMFYME